MSSESGFLMNVRVTKPSTSSIPSRFFCSARFPWILALSAVSFTLLVYFAEILNIHHPLKGNLELVLGMAELFGWLLVFGDNGSRFQLYTAGLPFALFCNGAAFWLFGYAIMKLARGKKRSEVVD